MFRQRLLLITISFFLNEALEAGWQACVQLLDWLSDNSRTSDYFVIIIFEKGPKKKKFSPGKNPTFYWTLWEPWFFFLSFLCVQHL